MTGVRCYKCEQSAEGAEVLVRVWLTEHERAEVLCPACLFEMVDGARDRENIKAHMRGGA